MANDRAGLIAGIIEVKIDGEIFRAKGNWTWNLGKVKKEMILGADGPHGFKGTPQAPRIEGEITDLYDLSVEDLVSLSEATVTLALANGKVIVLKRASYTADGDVQTEEGNIQAIFTGFDCTEVR